MSKRITLGELESYLWGSAQLLRTHIDAGSYKQYIFPLLFFKRLNDVYEEETDNAKRDYPDSYKEFALDEIHSFILPDDAHWSSIRTATSDVGTAIVKAFSKIEAANMDKLGGIFGSAAWTNKKRLPDSLLKDLIEHFSTKVLSIANCPEDELGEGYEYLVKKFADDSGHTAQEFYTNRTVVHLMTEILKPKPGESVYDPTCGSAGMLISSIAYLKNRGEEYRNVSAYGQELNSLTCSIGRMNLFLHGIRDFKVVNGDTLKSPAFLKYGALRTFDVVLANPPYSISEWDRDSFETDKFGRNFLGTPPQGRADYAFIQHILKSMDPEFGRCAILLPHGVLLREEESAIREKLVESDLIECVIGLGKGLFYNSPMESCVMICRTKKPVARKGKILLINAKEELIKRDGQGFLTNANIKRISECFESFADESGFSSVVSIEQIRSKGFSLSIPLYVDSDRKWHENDDGLTLAQSCEEWEKNSEKALKEMKTVVEMIGGANDA